MAVRPDYTTGTISVENGSTTVTGDGTAFTIAPVRVGDIVFNIPGATEYIGVIAKNAESNTELELALPWEGPTLTDVPYRIRFLPDGSRYTATATHLMELLENGNLEAFAELTGGLNLVPMFVGPGAMILVPKSDLISGAKYDVQVPTIAARAEYDTRPEGFSVLVSNTGDGRAAIYTKASNSIGDWSDPAYVTGPVGPTPIFEAEATTLDPDSEATASTTPITGGYQLNIGIPKGEGFDNKGVYSGAAAYVKGDVVTYNGSSYIAKGSTTGNVPTNTTYWDVLAIKGQDGTGIGDMQAINALSEITDKALARQNIEAAGQDDLMGLAGSVNDVSGAVASLADYINPRKYSGCKIALGANTGSIFTSNEEVPIPFDTSQWDYGNWWDISTPTMFYVPNNPNILAVRVNAFIETTVAAAALSEVNIKMYDGSNWAWQQRIVSPGGTGTFFCQYSGIIGNGISPAGKQIRLDFYNTDSTAKIIRANSHVVMEAIFQPDYAQV